MNNRNKGASEFREVMQGIPLDVRHHIMCQPIEFNNIAKRRSPNQLGVHFRIDRDSGNFNNLENLNRLEQSIKFYIAENMSTELHSVEYDKIGTPIFNKINGWNIIPKNTMFHVGISKLGDYEAIELKAKNRVDISASVNGEKKYICSILAQESFLAMNDELIESLTDMATNGKVFSVKPEINVDDFKRNYFMTEARQWLRQTNPQDLAELMQPKKSANFEI